MAGRPLKGSITRTTSGRFEASLPRRRGGKERISATFSDEAVAQQWLDLGITELMQGREPTPPDPSCEVHWFAVAARRWWEKRYMEAQVADPGRAKDVLRQLEMRIVPFFTARWATPADCDPEDVHTFFLHLAGRADAAGTVVVGTATSLPAIGRGTASGYATTLKAIGADLVARGTLATNPAAAAAACEPLESAVTRKSRGSTAPRILTIAESMSVAGGLHVVHQLVFWLQRLLGLRIAEVYGIRIGDIVHDGDYGLVCIEAQGGRTFLQWAANGSEEAVSRVKRTKTASSVRFIVIPPVLMRLIETFVRIVHGLPDGTVDLDARLIPGLKQDDVGGIEGYRTALAKAADAEIDVNGFWPHDLRKALSTDLAWRSDLSKLQQRRLVGHVAGTDVHGRVYVLDDPTNQAMKQAADEIDRIVTATTDSLIVPTERLPIWRHMNSRSGRADGIRADLIDAGWVLADDVWISTAEASELIGRNELGVRRLIHGGMLAGSKIRGASGTEWRVQRSSVEEFLSRYTDMLTLDEAAEQLELTYHQAYELQKRIGLDLPVDEVTRRLLVDGEQLQAMHAELGRIAALHERALPIRDAAKTLGRAYTTVKEWAGERLELDPETDSSGRRFVTRRSVDELRQKLAIQSASGRRNLPGRR